jgi:hypothetical protein
LVLIHEEKAEYNSWLKLIFILPWILLRHHFAINDFEAFPVLLGEAFLYVNLLFHYAQEISDL